MKFFGKIIAFIFLIVLITISCMKEVDVTEGENPNTNNSNSEITNKYKRIGMYDGTLDDFIDSISCSSVKFPYSLLANNIPLTISNISDYQLVKDIFNLSAIDLDTIVFDFPITIINQDYSETIVANNTEISNLSAICDSAIINNLSAITCVDIQYPISISLFNLDNDQTTFISIESDQDLFIFMNNLPQNEVYSVQYPINVSISSATSIVNNDSDLKSIIDNCINN